MICLSELGYLVTTQRALIIMWNSLHGTAALCVDTEAAFSHLGCPKNKKFDLGLHMLEA